MTICQERNFFSTEFTTFSTDLIELTSNHDKTLPADGLTTGSWVIRLNV